MNTALESKANSSDLNNYVTLTSNQTISGSKTISSDLNLQPSSSSANTGGAINFHYNQNSNTTSSIVENASGQIRVNGNILVDGTIMANNVYGRNINFNTGVRPVSSWGTGARYDSIIAFNNSYDNKTLSMVYSPVTFTSSTNYRNTIQLLVYDPMQENSFDTIQIGYNQNGVYTYAPTPATSDNSGQIATTSYVKSNLSSYVDLSSTQNISGSKTFTNALTVKTTGSYAGSEVIISNPDIVKGTAPSVEKYSNIGFYGDAVSSYSDRIGLVECQYNSDKSINVRLRAYNSTSAGNTNTCSISCNVDSSGNVYTYAPTPATSDNSTKIATTAFVKNVLTSLKPQIEQFDFGQNSSEYSTKPWLYLGQCNMPTQTNMMIFDVYAGNGQNGNSNQNLYIKIMLKRGYSTSGVGITAWVLSGDVTNQYAYSSGINVKGIKDSTGNILDLYVKMPYAYPAGACVLTNLASNTSFTSNFTFTTEPSGTTANCNVLFFNPSTYI